MGGVCNLGVQAVCLVLPQASTSNVSKYSSLGLYEKMCTYIFILQWFCGADALVTGSSS